MIITQSLVSCTEWASNMLLHSHMKCRLLLGEQRNADWLLNVALKCISETQAPWSSEGMKSLELFDLDRAVHTPLEKGLCLLPSPGVSPALPPAMSPPAQTQRLWSSDASNHRTQRPMSPTWVWALKSLGLIYFVHKASLIKLLNSTQFNNQELISCFFLEAQQ